MAPPAGTAEPTMENDGKQNHVLRQRKILIGRTIGLELGARYCHGMTRNRYRYRPITKARAGRGFRGADVGW